MNTSDIIRNLAKKMNLTLDNSKEVVNFIFNGIITEVRKGKEVKISGFGIFEGKERKGRKGRNPKNGDIVDIPPIRVPKFKPGKKLREGAAKYSSKSKAKVL